MTTPSYDKLATSTAIVMRSPGVVDGKVGPLAAAGTLSVTPPDTMDASAILGFGILNPHSTWVCYYEGNFEFNKGDRLVIDGVTYTLRNHRVFPHYRATGNSSVELVIELPEE